ncbi:MAG: LacI family DNA-binding transcriptional regulator [Stappiaceae bacterium]
MTASGRRRTMKDVAVAANVSEMTVSRVLRNKGPISKKTRRHVLQMVENLGYVQNHLAGSLATSRSNQIAVIIPSLVNNVFTEVMSGITVALEKAGYNAVVGISDYSLEKEEALVSSMMSWRPAGIIVANLQHTVKTRNILANAGIPVVEMMNIAPNPIDVCIGLDHSAAGTAIADHLLSKGYRHFGYVGWNREDRAAHQRFQAIVEQIGSNNLSIVAPDLFEAPPNFAAGKAGLRQLLDIAPNLDAVFFSNDTAATGGMIHCIESGIDVPDQLAIAGFSGLDTGQNMPLKLTTIKTRRYDIGRLSARNILNRLAGQASDPVVDLGFEIIAGETS